jgi:hypothetical protein
LSINQPLATIVSQDFVFSAFSQPIRVSLIHELSQQALTFGPMRNTHQAQ